MGAHVNVGARLVVAVVDGRVVTLSPPVARGDGDPGLGHVMRAGLRDRPPRVLSGPGQLSFGSPEVYLRMRAGAWRPDGSVASLPTTTVLLHPGFG